MKYLITLSLFIAVVIIACNHHEDAAQHNNVDSLKSKPADTYKPGLGEFMSGIQVHHAKLWFAGKEQNWPLANFEINEIIEAIADIKQYCFDRPEVKLIGMIDQPIDSISNAIRQKNMLLFRSGYVLLTNTCNKCHQATEHEFNVIVIPTNPPFSNQDFKVH